MMQTYRFRLYPNQIQTTILEETLETCRRLYNDLLDDRIKNHSNVFAQNKILARRRKKNRYLKQVFSQVIQDVAFRLDKAFAAFFVGMSSHPKFKRKGHYNSFTYPQHWNRGGFAIIAGKLRLSMIGRLSIRPTREMVGKPKTCTIIRDVDQWYACIVTQSTEYIKDFGIRPAVGIDLGVSKVATLSDGTVIPSPHFLQGSEDEIKSLQRLLSRKMMGSKNRAKLRVKLARTWRRIRDRRNDFAHKTSKFLADNYGTIVFEDLQITNMTKNHSIASAILDACWGKLRRLTAYKVERRGGRELLVRPMGKSQECSRCGGIVAKNLSEKVHRCTNCGLELDRDLNAARNILAPGLERTPAEAGPLPIRRIGKFSRGSKKPEIISHG